MIVTDGALDGLNRCKHFLFEENPLAMKRAANVIRKAFSLLATSPEIGRPLTDIPELRELI